MSPKLLLPSILALPLFAQVSKPVPKLHILLHADPPSQELPALNTVEITGMLRDFAKQKGMAEPIKEGDGLILGVHLETQVGNDGVIVAIGGVRLFQPSNDEFEIEGPNEATAIVMARTRDLLSLALGREIVRRAEALLTKAGVLAPPPQDIIHEVSPPKLSQYDRTVRVDFNKGVTVTYQPPPPSYPLAAKIDHVQGNVELEVVIDPEGRGASVTAIQGPEPLLTTAMAYGMKWRFKPVMYNGKPVWAKFRLNMNFRLE